MRVDVCSYMIKGFMDILMSETRFIHQAGQDNRHEMTRNSVVYIL